MPSRRAPSLPIVLLALAGLAAPASGARAWAETHTQPPQTQAQTQTQTQAQTRAQAIDAACGLLKDDDGGDYLDDRCLVALAFDTRAYFGDWSAGVGDSAVDGGAPVTVHYDNGRASPRWAFAIDDVCPGAASSSDHSCPLKARHEVMRLVTLDRPRAGLPPPVPPLAQPPRSAGDLRRALDVLGQWREADLRTCSKAAAVLLSLQTLRLTRFDDWARARITGARLPDTFTVTADADGYRVHVGDAINGATIWDEGKPGGAGAWAQRMRRASEPCLKPAPWR